MNLWSGRLCGVCLASAGLGIGLVENTGAQSKAQKSIAASDCIVDRLTKGEALAKGDNISIVAAPSAGGGSLAPCPPVTVTHSSHNFTNGSLTAQGGMVNTEIAAVSYTIDSSHFPIRIDRVDVLVSTPSLANQVTERWSVLVWEGDPNTGTLVYTITSDDDGNPPHIMASPPVNTVHLQASVDPGDPEQIIVTNNGSNRFSVGYRIDQHNLSASSTCPCVPQFPGLGNFPPICCPPPSNQNLFPSTDVDGLQQPSRNWLFARDCPGATGFCPTGASWVTNSEAGISGDWNIRAMYTPQGCQPATGACCAPAGNCLNGVTAAQCQSQSGTYQGDNSNCSGINCPIPSGACCLNGGQTCTSLSQAACVSQGGTFLGVNSICGANSCRGACCIPPSNCLNTIQASCTGNNTFAGIGTTCATHVCFPIGACCLPNGACASNVSPSQCQAQNGVFQGNASTCQGSNCPVPEGACCFGDECFDFITQVDCEGLPGGIWAGPNTVCSSNPCSTPACTGDDNADQVVNIDDLVRVITNWGACIGCTPPGTCEGDTNDNCVVNIDDLVIVVTNWGPC